MRREEVQGRQREEGPQWNKGEIVRKVEEILCERRRMGSSDELITETAGSGERAKGIQKGGESS